MGTVNFRFYLQNCREHSDASELEEEPQLAREGSPLFMETLVASSMDSPLATSEVWLQRLVTGSSSMEVPQWPMGEELKTDAAGTMMLQQDSLSSTDWWTD
jgi:hypothetical protein